MAEGLKVLIMGGQRVGKSSALAALMDAFVTGAEKEILTARDITTLGKNEGEKQVSLQSKLRDVKEMLSSNAGRKIIVDSGKTSKKWDYKLQLTLAGSNDSMEIVFTDVNGEFFEGGNRHQPEIIELMKGYDVFIVAIDTPFMMEARNDDSPLVDAAVNMAYNCTDSIHTFLSHIDDNDGKDAKLVIFTPVKCEYWARGNELEKVAEAVKEDYATSIRALSSFGSIQIEVLPVQTVGSAVFAGHMEAFTCEWTERRMLFFKKHMRDKCGVMPDGSIMLSDGTLRKRSDVSTLQEDMDAVMYGSILRPNAWFAIESSEYRPHNCEQLALHILEFMLAKATDARIKQERSQNSILKGLKKAVNFLLNAGTLGLWDKLRDLFGSISIEQMQKAMGLIREKNLIKHQGEGITIIREVKFEGCD